MAQRSGVLFRAGRGGWVAEVVAFRRRMHVLYSMTHSACITILIVSPLAYHRAASRDTPSYFQVDQLTP